MAVNPQPEIRWAPTGAVSGLLTTIGYLAFAALPMPTVMRRGLFFFLPLGGILFVAGLYALLRDRGESVLLQIAALFGVIGFAVMNILAVVQISIHLRMSRRLPTAADPASRQLIQWVQDSVNAVHLGLDVSFDIFVLLSLTLFAISMLSHPRFGRLYGVTGAALSAATLLLNLHSFPVPPNPDLGPVVGLWGLAVAIRMFRYRQPESGKVASRPGAGR